MGVLLPYPNTSPIYPGVLQTTQVPSPSPKPLAAYGAPLNQRPDPNSLSGTRAHTAKHFSEEQFIATKRGSNEVTTDQADAV